MIQTGSQQMVSSKDQKKKNKMEMLWMKDLNLKIVQIEEDGNCLFRALSHQLYGSQDFYDVIRTKCCEYIEHEKQFFGGFIGDLNGTVTFMDYLRNMTKDGTWGGNLELMALAEIYQKTIEIYRSNLQPDFVFGGEYSNAQNEEPIRLHYRK